MYEIVVSAPGKVIIHGEHAVVYGKKALAASLDLRTFMQVKKRTDGKLVLSLPDIALSGEWHVHELPTCFGRTLTPEDPAVPTPDMLSTILDFLKLPSGTQDTKNLAVALFIYFYILLNPDGGSSAEKEFCGGLSVTAASNIPTGAGLGSSAAFCVCLAASLLRIANVICEPQMSEGSALLTWNERDLCIINKWAFVGEKVIHGNASGIDNSVSCFGGVFTYQKGALERLTSVHKLRILLTNTKIPRSTRAMVANVAKRNNMFPDVVGPILSSIESISETSLKLLTSSDVAPPSLYEHLTGLIEINQHLLAALGVSHAAINEVCEITAKHGLASKLTGAGGGGCVITLLKSADQDDQKIDDAKADLQAHMYSVHQTSLGSIGVSQHREDNVETLAPDIRQHFH